MEWWKKFLEEDINESIFNANEIELFKKYQLNQNQKRIFQIVKLQKNMPSFWKDMDPEHIIWVIGVKNHGHRDDMKYYLNSVIRMLEKYKDAEKKYNWFNGKWEKKHMQYLIKQWFSGMMVVDPKLKTKDGNPIVCVHEYYGSFYPEKKDQTEEWKKMSLQMYVYMSRSICKSYSNASMKGLVSVSDMKDFDFEKYDMDTKRRHGDLGTTIPNKLIKMIQVNPSKRMKESYKTFGNLKRFGVVIYDDFKTCYEKEKDYLPKEMPTFIGGTYKCDILECLKYLFRTEKDALKLMLETYNELKDSNEIPMPKHML